MKANELMIGDWVTLNGIDYKWQWTHHDFTVSEFGTLEPIPLTAEILEKNGFHNKGDWAYKRVRYNGTYDVAVSLKYNVIEILKVCGAGTDCEDVEYSSTLEIAKPIQVHELQHALRLCGLNELADGLKI